MIKRLSVYIILAVSFFIMPWWVTIFLAVVAVFVAPLFYESVVITTFALAVFTGAGVGLICLGTLVTILLVFLVESLIKPRMAWYDKINEQIL